jgi:hypothetical protein
MIVINRNGQPTVITGWRAWLIGAVAFVAGVLLFGVIAFFMLGVAVTVGAILLIAVPAAIIVAFLASAFGRKG